MAEKWLLKTYDGEEYNLRTSGDAGYGGVDTVYNLLIGTMGHYGMPVSILSDTVPNVPGTEFRKVVRGDRTVYLPLAIIGSSPSNFHKSLEKFRKSLNPEYQCELWVTNEEGETRVLYCRYLKGFDAALDDDKRGPNWIKMPLYVIAEDPFWYDPPGSELTQNFSSSPWTEDFFTFTENVGLLKDAPLGATQIVLNNTQNCAVDKPIELRAATLVTSDMLSFENMGAYNVARPTGVKLGGVGVSVPASDTVTSITVSSTSVQVGQAVQISGSVKLTDGSSITSRVPQGEGATLLLYATGGIKSRWNESAYSGDGKYHFTIVPDKAGNYTFQVRFLADEIFCKTSWSDVISVNAGVGGGGGGDAGTTTTLTLTSSTGNPAVNTTFALSGKLLSGTTPFFGKTITLYKKTQQGNVKIGTVTTDSNGAYSMNYKETTTGWASYKASFAGITTSSVIAQANVITTQQANSSVTQSVTQTQSQNVTGSGNVINFTGQNNTQSSTNTVVNIVSNIGGTISSIITNLFNTIINRINGVFKVTVYAPADAYLVIPIGTFTYPINYQAALPASMVNDGEIQYFGYNGYNGIILIAESAMTTAEDPDAVHIGGTYYESYATEYDTITSQGLFAAIDISVMSDSEASLSSYHDWFTALHQAGWRYIAGINSTGRTGDPAYLDSLFTTGQGKFKYINYRSDPTLGATTNPDVSGTGVYRNSFRCFTASEINYIEPWTATAYGASPRVLSGITAGVITNDTKQSNQMLTNSVANDSPTYFDILNWSYQNFVGMNNFVVWFHPKYSGPPYYPVGPRDPEPEQISDYKSLGFAVIVSELQDKYYPPITTWVPPDQTGVFLTMTYTDPPLILSGNLSTITAGDPISSTQVVIEELPGTFFVAQSATFASADSSSPNIILTSGASNFIPNQTVTIADKTYSETAVISSVVGDTEIILTDTPANPTYTNGTITSTNFPGGQNTVLVSSVASFLAGDVVTLSDNIHTDQTTSVITADTTPNSDGSYTLTLADNLNSGGFNIVYKDRSIVYGVGSTGLPKSVAGSWSERGTVSTDSSGNWVMDTRLWDPTPASGVHQYRATFNEDGSYTDYLTAYAPSQDGMAVTHTILTETQLVKETNRIKSVDSPTVITLYNATQNEYLISNGAYATEIDDIDAFLNPADVTTPRTVNDHCTLIQFWLPGCPPCMSAMAQLNALVENYPNVTYTHVNVVEPNPYGSTNLFEGYNTPGDIGMTAATAQYPEAVQFSQPKKMVTCSVCDGTGTIVDPTHNDEKETCPICNGAGTINIGGQCGPSIPSWGPMNIIDDIMPTVICLYRGGLFVAGWCGVHTTGVDPVSTETILEACGPRTTWKLGKSSIGSRVVVINNGDATAYPVWTITGPGKTPSFTNVTTGETFILNHELVDGEAVMIDATDYEHTVGSTASSAYLGEGYTKAETCPTCHGTGSIPTCATCGGAAVCPTCHGSGTISVWVPSAAGSTTDISGMYNLRFAIDQENNNFWGFQPGANVIEVELGTVEYGKSIINLSIAQRYEGV